MVTFVKSVLIAAPVEAVFCFHERDEALALLAPAFPPVRMISSTSGLKIGACVELRVALSTGSAALTIHARADFSRRYLEAPKEDVAKFLLAAAQPWFSGPVTVWQLQRWRYSRPVETGRRPTCLFSRQPARLAIAGDVFGGSRLEGAFLSGLAAAERIADT